MKFRQKLFSEKEIYNLPYTELVFFKAMKDNIRFHMENCPAYQKALGNLGFTQSSLDTMDDVFQVPPLPASYLKNNTLLSKPYHKLLVKTTSSGTGGKKLQSGFDFSSGLCGLRMVMRVFRYYNLQSCKSANYIILGYKPNPSNQTAMAKALKYVKLTAPAKKTVYALEFDNGKYQINTDGLVSAIESFSKENRPVRIIGFPAYLKMFLLELNKRKIKVTLHTDSKILVGGGWKALFAEAISKEELFAMAEETLGIRRENFRDHFSTAEHPINYISCDNHHFHIPVFSRVSIRDVYTLDPLPFGKPGLLNLVTPLLSSVPYGSVLTDDIAVMKKSEDCGCGIPSPYFDIIGRIGQTGFKTCTQTASEYLERI